MGLGNTFAGNMVEILAPVDGKVVQLFEVEDHVFKNKIVGDGLAIEPCSNVFVAPASGVVVNVARTKHSISIQITGKATIMVHMGLDTVYLGGSAFKCFVAENQAVKCGDIIAEMDLEDVLKNQKSIITPIILIDNKSARLKKTRENFVRRQDKLFTVML
jgi:glucose-specific phosphotransferase system IIA component